MEMDWKYLGGLFDGEGCVAIYIYDEIRPRIVICSFFPSFNVMVRAFLSKEGIEGYLPPKNHTQLQIYGWENTVKFAQKILPYTIIKNEELKLLIKANDINTSKNTMYPPELLKIIIKLHEMKTKGRKSDKSLNKARLLLRVQTETNIKDRVTNSNRA